MFLSKICMNFVLNFFQAWLKAGFLFGPKRRRTMNSMHIISFFQSQQCTSRVTQICYFIVDIYLKRFSFRKINCVRILSPQKNSLEYFTNWKFLSQHLGWLWSWELFLTSKMLSSPNFPSFIFKSVLTQFFNLTRFLIFFARSHNLPSPSFSPTSTKFLDSKADLTQLFIPLLYLRFVYALVFILEVLIFLFFSEYQS